MIDNPFVNDTPCPCQQKRPGRWVDATVTGTSPLLVRLDGYEEISQPPTKPPLVAGLAVGDKVICRLEGKQLVVHGRYGG